MEPDSPAGRLPGEGVFNLLKHEKPLSGLMALTVLVYTFLSSIRQWRFMTGGFDLGIYDQVVWEYSRFLAPASTLRNLSNALGDHFEPILALVAPLYWVLPGPEALFFVQSAAVALGAVAVFRFTQRRLGRAPAYQWTIAYLVFWGTQNALGYDFHGVLLAVPFIAFAIDFTDLQQRGKAFACLTVLLFVKEDLGLWVAFFGLYLLLAKRWKWGLACFATGTAGFLLEVMVVVPYLARPQPYSHWLYPDFGNSPLEALGTVAHHPLWVFQVWFSDPRKSWTLLWSFAACAFTAFGSPWVILTLPLLAERMLSNSPSLWSMGFHYSATLAPVLMMAGADGLFRLARAWKGGSRFLPAVRVVSALVMVLNLGTIPIFSLRDLTRPKFYQSEPYEKTGRQLSALIPKDAVVLAQDTVVPHLSQRKGIFMISNDNLGMDCDYFVACRYLPLWPFESYDPIEKAARERLERGYSKIFEGDGWILLKRTALPPPDRENKT